MIRSQQTWCDAAWAEVDGERLAILLAEMVAIASPTGEEAVLAQYVAERLTAAGAAGAVQHLYADQANAWGRLGALDVPAVMLYAPIDTLTTGNTREDLPWAGEQMRADMRAEPTRTGDVITGLGAGNPKGHAACVLGAMEALGAVQFPGAVAAGFGAGGMPTNGRPGRPDTGHGIGCTRLLDGAVRPRTAIIAKPGNAVSWEEVGLAWFDVIVRGTHTYVGARHRLPYSNAIAQAGRLAAAIDEWFPSYTAAHTDGLVAPQGTVAFIEGGTPRTSAFTPAVCRIRVDLRLSPRTTPHEACNEFAQAVASLACDLGIEAEVVPTLGIPGGSTPRDHPVCVAARAAFEAVEGRPHADVGGMSGATDANILRGRGVPTARVGMAKVMIDGVEPDFALGMNTADVGAMERLTKLLIHAAVQLCIPETDEHHE